MVGTSNAISRPADWKVSGCETILESEAEIPPASASALRVTNAGACFVLFCVKKEAVEVDEGERVREMCELQKKSQSYKRA
jgi:hypothetical protein